ncbi:MAG: hypothetical protein AB7T49_17805 [Oligoflexales bacterium]
MKIFVGILVVGLTVVASCKSRTSNVANAEIGTEEDDVFLQINGANYACTSKVSAQEGGDTSLEVRGKKYSCSKTSEEGTRVYYFTSHSDGHTCSGDLVAMTSYVKNFDSEIDSGEYCQFRGEALGLSKVDCVSLNPQGTPGYANGMISFRSACQTALDDLQN